MDRTGLPLARAGMCVGILGGSFDPPHAGHAHITREALKRFGLDRIWWVVSPGNPLKREGPAPLARRMAVARLVMDHPRVAITDIESRIGTRYTAETLSWLIAAYPGVRFIWLMGADNMADFHRWQRWRWILDTVPVGVLARPGQRISARTSPAALAYARHRMRISDAPRLCFARVPAWCFVNVPMMNISSSEIRAKGAWRS